MSTRSKAAVGTLIALILLVRPATALTMTEFARICQSGPVACSEHPILNAYVGGALDLIAMLDEQTDYLGKVYCKPPKTLFDVPAIIRYMEARQSEYADRNATLVLIRYLEENGGC